MLPRHRTYLITGLAAAGIAGAVLFAWRNGQASTTPDALLRRLPTQNAVVAGLDFDALRRSGLLAALTDSKTPQEADYLAFVRQTGFDYKRDLRYVLVSFSPDGEFFLVKGTFDWPKLERYVAQQKGSCFERLCRLTGSTPERKISFFPLKRDLLAMAVAADDTAASRLREPGPQGGIDVPNEPVWVSFSAGALSHATSLPGSSKLLASAISDAERVTITAGQSGGRIEARLDAICRDAHQAGALTAQLRAVTSMLRNAAQQEGQPILQSNLGGLLTAGTFEQSGSHVVGHWPVAKELIANLTGGI